MKPTKKRNKKYTPKELNRSDLLITLYKNQRKYYKIDRVVDDVLIWLNHIANHCETEVNQYGVWVMDVRCDEGVFKLPCWEGFESLLDLHDIAESNGYRYSMFSLVAQMRDWTKNGMPVSPKFALDVRMQVERFADFLKKIPSEDLQRIADTTLTRIYLQKAVAKKEVAA